MRISKVSAAALAASVMFGGAALAFADDAMPADPSIVEETTTTTAGDADPTTTSVTDATEATTTTTVLEPTTTTVAGGEEETDGDGDGAKVHPDNHGKAVSEAAHATPPGPGHGKAVSEVARSNHGHTKGENTTKAPKAKKPKKTASTTE